VILGVIAHGVMIINDILIVILFNGAFSNVLTSKDFLNFLINIIIFFEILQYNSDTHNARTHSSMSILED